MLRSCLPILLAASATLPPAPPIALEVEPAEVRLRGSDSRAQIVATGGVGREGERDLTRDPATDYESLDPAIATVDREGLICPRGVGRTRVRVRSGALSSAIEVSVEDFADRRPVAFASEVVPIFTKLGCNGGTCHGKAGGQNGFRLSLLGFDPGLDFESLARDDRGRRVFPAAPGSSLLLLKPTAAIAHGGGLRLAIDSPEYRTITRWIGQGLPAPGSLDEPRVSGISVWPDRRRLWARETQQLRVSAHQSDGRTIDVTRLSQYESNAPELATVDGRGTVQVGLGVGEAAIMVRFGGQVAVARLLVPSVEEPPAWEPPASTNLIDPFVFQALRELNLVPSGPCTDGEFARRSALDVCGVLPTPAEVAALEADTRADKRARWVDRLVDRPEYADLFAAKWGAILRNQRSFGAISQPGTFAFHDWVRQSLAENKPYDRFAAEIVAAVGDATFHPPVVWYRQVKGLEEQVDDTAQLFLGLRLQCARCHQHPYERWGPGDYYGFAAFFSRIGRKPGLDPITPSLFLLPEGSAEDPNTLERHAPRFLGGAAWTDPDPRHDPRQALVDWMRRPDNPYFARALVNRYWKHFFGRGLVEPEDDLRTSNPPTHPELLDALAEDFIGHGFDLKHLVRTIASSRAYDRSSLPVASEPDDRQHYARFAPRRLPAEVLLDAIGTVTGVREPFAGLPRSFRATQLPDDGFASAFLEVFGRPRRESVCECERRTEANLAQSLLLLNSATIQRTLQAVGGRIDRWMSDPGPDAAKVEELYRVACSRAPNDEERAVCLGHLARCRVEGRLRQGYEDLVWTLINTKEFLFTH